jgi:hypothetical protein
MFKDGLQSTEDGPRFGRLLRSDDVAKIYEKMRNNRKLTVHELANETEISIRSCHEIFS